jgi:hypothetical protein
MADALADTPSNVGDEVYGELRKHFTEEELMGLAANAALENFRGRASLGFSTSAAITSTGKVYISNCTARRKT